MAGKRISWPAPVLLSLPPHPFICGFLHLLFQTHSCLHCNHSFSPTHCFSNLPLCILREFTAWLHWNWILRMGVGERAECMEEVTQVYVRSQWSPPNNLALALIKQMEMCFDHVSRGTAQSSTLRLRKHHRRGSSSWPGATAQPSILTSCPTSVLWLQGTGMVVGIWAMPGRWLLVPVLDFKLDLQSEKQRPRNSTVRAASEL